MGIIDTVDVSIIITSYNVETYIERAIRSALIQEGVTVEVIVVDDCSTDDTWAVIARMDDARVKPLKLENNSGPSVARNAGIAKAIGSWIAILDGDDAFAPNRLQQCLKCAAAHNADIIIDNIMVSREADGAQFQMFSASHFPVHSTMDLAAFIAGNQYFLGGYTYGYLKPIFSARFLRDNKIAYDPTIRIGEDYLIMAEALASGAKCAVEPNAGYIYTVRKKSISHRIDSTDIEQIAICDDHFVSRHQLHGAALKAQKKRQYLLKEALAFTKLIDAMKTGDGIAALKAVFACPTALRHLWRPAWARLERLSRKHGQTLKTS